MFRRRPDPIDALLREARGAPSVHPEVGTAVRTDGPTEAPPVLSAAPADDLERPATAGASDAAPAPTAPAGSRDPVRVPPVVIGTPSTFGSEDWWRSGWWPLTASGDARDVQADLGTLGDLAVAAVTCRGNKHRLEGTSCEDAFHLRAVRSAASEYAVLAVCDGVGSARRSSIGSQRLSRTVTHAVADGIARGLDDPELLLVDAIQSSVGRLAKFADEHGYELRDLETTLTVAIVPAAPGGPSEALIGWIGDSPAFIGQGQTWRCITAEAAEEAVATSATRGALTARPEHLAVLRVPLRPGERLLLSSDGVGNFIGRDSGNLALGDHLADALANPVDLPTLVRHATFDLRSADDDRTLALVWKAPTADGSTPR